MYSTEWTHSRMHDPEYDAQREVQALEDRKRELALRARDWGTPSHAGFGTGQVKHELETDHSGSKAHPWLIDDDSQIARDPRYYARPRFEEIEPYNVDKALKKGYTYQKFEKKTSTRRRQRPVRSSPLTATKSYKRYTKAKMKHFATPKRAQTRVTYSPGSNQYSRIADHSPGYSRGLGSGGSTGSMLRGDIVAQYDRIQIRRQNESGGKYSPDYRERERILAKNVQALRNEQARAAQNAGMAEAAFNEGIEEYASQLVGLAGDNPEVILQMLEMQSKMEGGAGGGGGGGRGEGGPMPSMGMAPPPPPPPPPPPAEGPGRGGVYPGDRRAKTPLHVSASVTESRFSTRDGIALTPKPTQAYKSKLARGADGGAQLASEDGGEVLHISRKSSKQQNAHNFVPGTRATSGKSTAMTRSTMSPMYGKTGKRSKSPYERGVRSKTPRSSPSPPPEISGAFVRRHHERSSSEITALREKKHLRAEKIEFPPPHADGPGKKEGAVAKASKRASFVSHPSVDGERSKMLEIVISMEGAQASQHWRKPNVMVVLELIECSDAPGGMAREAMEMIDTKRLRNIVNVVEVGRTEIMLGLENPLFSTSFLISPLAKSDHRILRARVFDMPSLEEDDWPLWLETTISSDDDRFSGTDNLADRLKRIDGVDELCVADVCTVDDLLRDGAVERQVALHLQRNGGGRSGSLVGRSGGRTTLNVDGDGGEFVALGVGGGGWGGGGGGGGEKVRESTSHLIHLVITLSSPDTPSRDNNHVLWLHTNVPRGE